jgi:hypothetical protein
MGVSPASVWPYAVGYECITLLFATARYMVKARRGQDG